MRKLLVLIGWILVIMGCAAATPPSESPSKTTNETPTATTKPSATAPQLPPIPSAKEMTKEEMKAELHKKHSPKAKKPETLMSRIKAECRRKKSYLISEEECVQLLTLVLGLTCKMSSEGAISEEAIIEECKNRHGKKRCTENKEGRKMLHELFALCDLPRE